MKTESLKPRRLPINHRVQSLLDRPAHRLAKVVVEARLTDLDKSPHRSGIFVLVQFRVQSADLKRAVVTVRYAKDLVRYLAGC